MKIFDTHTHVFPDRIAAHVLAHLSELSHGLPPQTLGTWDDLARQGEEAGYTGWMNCPVVTRPGQFKSLNTWASEHNHWPGLSLGGIHPEDTDHAGIIHQIRDLGLHGLKMHPEYQEFGVLEKRVEDIWCACEEESMPVIIHGADDVGFEPPYHSKPADFAELSRRHPGLVIIVAHLGGWNQWDAVEHDLVGSNVYMDTSFAYSCMKDKSQFARIVRAHGSQRILYGTDSPWQDLKTSIREIQSQGFSQEELSDIFWNTANTVWHLDSIQ